MEYCIITPLGVSGGIHCKVTEIEVTENTTNERGSLGTANKFGSIHLLACKLTVSNY